MHRREKRERVTNGDTAHVICEVQYVASENQNNESKNNDFSEMDVYRKNLKRKSRVTDCEILVNLSRAKQAGAPDIRKYVEMTLPVSWLSSVGTSSTSGSVANTLVGWITTPCLFFV